VVLELVGERGVDAALVRVLDGVLLTEASKNRALDVLGGSDIKAMLSHQSEKQLLGCLDTACLVEIGGALGSDLLLIMTVGRVGDYYVLNLKLLDVGRASVAGRVSSRVDANENALFNAVAPAVRQVFAAATSVPGVETMQSLPAAPTAVGPDRTLTWISLGAVVVLAGGGGAALALAGSKGDIRNDEYAAYLDATTVGDRDTRYGDIEDAVGRHNSMVLAGWALLGAATVATGIAAYDLATAEPEATADVAVAPAAGGAVLILRGAF